MYVLNVVVSVRLDIGLLRCAAVFGVVRCHWCLYYAILGKGARVHWQTRVTCTAAARGVSAACSATAASGQAVGLHHQHKAHHGHDDHAECHEGHGHCLVPDSRSVEPGQKDLGLAVTTIHQVSIAEAAHTLVITRASANTARIVAALARECSGSLRGTS